MDFFEESALEMFCCETYGGKPKDINGYYWGKHWMDVTITMWNEDLQKNPPILLLCELYEDERFPDWWLDKVLKPPEWQVLVNKGS